jgi:hypothetical protein
MVESLAFSPWCSFALNVKIPMISGVKRDNFFYTVPNSCSFEKQKKFPTKNSTVQLFEAIIH